MGLAFEPGLVERILDDVGEEPGNLPLLEFALTTLWEQRRGGYLLHEAYEAMGKVEGAIARRAEEQFSHLSPLEQQAVSRVFLELVRPGAGCDDTRRRARLTEIGETARPLVQQLADARLLVTGRDTATGAETVEVAHEALIWQWHRLQGWLDANREFLLWRQRLRADLEEWQRLGQEPGSSSGAPCWPKPGTGWHNGPGSEARLNASLFRPVSPSKSRRRKRNSEKQRRELEQAQALAAEQQRRAEAEQSRAAEQEKRAETERRSRRRLSVPYRRPAGGFTRSSSGQPFLPGSNATSAR